jgi:hypothetical protein
VLYTDGLTEARQNGDFFGEHRLLERVQSLVPLSPRELTQSLCSEALAFSGGRLGDDLAILAVRLHSASEAAVRSLLWDGFDGGPHLLYSRVSLKSRGRRMGA